jgi:hypothetical protein
MRFCSFIVLPVLALFQPLPPSHSIDLKGLPGFSAIDVSSLHSGEDRLSEAIISVFSQHHYTRWQYVRMLYMY